MSPRLAHVLLAAACFGLLAGCEGAPPAPPLPAGPTLSPTEQLVRVSMALRGVRPSLAELAEVQQDPALLSELVDGYLHDPRFGRVIVDIHDEALLVRTDFEYYPAGFPAIGALADVGRYELNRSLQESSLRLAKHVVMNDRPYTEVATADYFMANRVVAAVWGDNDYDPNGNDWQVTHWTDGRPTSGFLSDPMVFSRHASTIANANRGRANAMTKALLCFDYLEMDIGIDSSAMLAEQDGLASSISENENCQMCHKTLDPIAAFFVDHYPLYLPSELTEYPFPAYLPGGFAGVEFPPPALWGQPGNGIDDLGTMMAADPMFSACAARRFYAFFHQIEPREVPLQQVKTFQSVLLDSGFNARALVRAIVLSDDFLLAVPAAETTARRWVLRTRPRQLDSLMQDLTGYRWESDLGFRGYGTLPLLQDTFMGFASVAGAIDGLQVTEPSHAFSGPGQLLTRRLAQLSAGYVVEHDFAQSDATERRLLRYVEPSQTDESVLRQQLSWLHARLYGEMVEANDPLVDESLQLFNAARELTDDGASAWRTTLTAMLQDLRIASY